MCWELAGPGTLLSPSQVGWSSESKLFREKKIKSTGFLSSCSDAPTTAHAHLTFTFAWRENIQRPTFLTVERPHPPLTTTQKLQPVRGFSQVVVSERLCCCCWLDWTSATPQKGLQYWRNNLVGKTKHKPKLKTEKAATVRFVVLGGSVKVTELLPSGTTLVFHRH